MTENKELKCCPFCGGEPLEELNSEDDKIIVCQKCGAGTAPRVWNTRHNEAPTGEIGELIERIDATINKYEHFGIYTSNLGILNDCKARLQQAQKMREVVKEVHAILRTGSYGDGTWNALSPSYRKMFFEMLDKALNNEG